VVEWWSGGVVEWWSGGVVEWWSGGVVEWWSAILPFQIFASWTIIFFLLALSFLVSTCLVHNEYGDYDEGSFDELLDEGVYSGQIQDIG
jgi:1,4-dihydroxy-2-naphthoate octaprenyltransferase